MKGIIKEIYVITKGSYSDYVIQDTLYGPASCDLKLLFKTFCQTYGFPGAQKLRSAAQYNRLVDQANAALRADGLTIEEGPYDAFSQWLIRDHGFEAADFHEVHISLSHMGVDPDLLAPRPMATPPATKPYRLGP